MYNGWVNPNKWFKSRGGRSFSWNNAKPQEQICWHISNSADVRHRAESDSAVSSFVHICQRFLLLSSLLFYLGVNVYVYVQPHTAHHTFVFSSITVGYAKTKMILQVSSTSTPFQAKSTQLTNIIFSQMPFCAR
jgi:hypothetical protein